jgi:membrane-bound lytic murein transglycosylase MltF
MKKLILKTQLAVLCCFLFTISCKQSTAPVTSKPPDPQVSPAAQAAQTPEAIDPTLLERLKNERWNGDIDKLRERRYIRALVLYNKTNFFYDGPQPRGITYEALKEFEKFLNTRLNSGDKPLHLVFIPVSREEGIKRMKDGRGDIAASNVPIMPELQKVVDFSDPIREGAKEVIVTGPSDPAINTLDDLAGKEIFIRKVSRYWPNLERLNERFRAQGKPAIILKEADANLEDEDILDMVNAGLVGITVMDDLVAGLWAKIHASLSVHNDISIADGDKIGWAIQKGTPQFLSLINEFVKDHKAGPAEMEKFKGAVAFFKKYAAQYKFEWLMITAQAYQESTIDQAKTSSAGAVGVMQIKPSTAAGDPINIEGVDKDMEKNINAGVKYLNFIMETYFKDAQMNSTNRGLFAFASYNAGPNRIAKLRKQAEAEGLNPNLWFDNVEMVAAKEIGAETVTYVSNIYKYYVAYQLAAESTTKRQTVKKS